MYARYCITNSVINEIKKHSAIGGTYLEEKGKSIKGECFNEDEYLSYIENNLPPPGGSLDMEMLNSTWFPIPEKIPHVFISHSHKDDKEVLALVGFLKIYLGIDCFVDSWQWGYYTRLLKIIDNKYCKNEKENTYCYNTRNITTSLMSVSLLTSLQKIMDKIECTFFIGSQNSVIENIGREYVDKSKLHTASVWIYAEHMAMNTLRIKKPRRETISLHASHDSYQRNIVGDSLPRTSFPIDMKNIPNIYFNTLNEIRMQTSSPELALDKLYSAIPEGITQ